MIHSPPHVVGAYEAKTKLAQLLDRAEAGEEITITRHDRPVARLVPINRLPKTAMDELFRQMDEIRARTPLNPPGMEKLSLKSLIEEGRKR
jgi:prevent-host-death family protein